MTNVDVVSPVTITSSLYHANVVDIIFCVVAVRVIVDLSGVPPLSIKNTCEVASNVVSLAYLPYAPADELHT